MFGQRASSQIVCRDCPWISFLTSKYCEFALGARTFIHSGRRGRSATGSELSTGSSLVAASNVAAAREPSNSLLQSFVVTVCAALGRLVRVPASSGPDRLSNSLLLENR